MIFRLTLLFQAEDGIRDVAVTGVQTCALPISLGHPLLLAAGARYLYDLLEKGDALVPVRLDPIGYPSSKQLVVHCTYTCLNPLKMRALAIKRFYSVTVMAPTGHAPTHPMQAIHSWGDSTDTWPPLSPKPPM